MRLWWPFQLLTIVALIGLTACATKDPAVENLVGSEPQRLSFGPPVEVRTSFLQKMKTCWFANAAAPLYGYKYDVGEKPQGPDNNGPGYYGIMISNITEPSQTLEVQFHKYNENTLVVTRNGSLPGTLVDRLKRDIQLWALTGNECTNS